MNDDRWPRPARSWVRRRAGGLLAAMLCGVAGIPVGLAQTASGLNPYSDGLLDLAAPQRAAKLAAYVGFSCIGTKPFLMGVTKEGPAKGYAYWSLTCAGDNKYMIQITPDGEGASTECSTLKQGGEGRECYKKF